MSDSTLPAAKCPFESVTAYVVSMTGVTRSVPNQAFIGITGPTHRRQHGTCLFVSQKIHVVNFLGNELGSSTLPAANRTMGPGRRLVGNGPRNARN